MTVDCDRLKKEAFEITMDGRDLSLLAKAMTVFVGSVSAIPQDELDKLLCRDCQEALIDLHNTILEESNRMVTMVGSSTEEQGQS